MQNYLRGVAVSQPTYHEQSLAPRLIFWRLETQLEPARSLVDITIRELIDHELVYTAQLTYHIPYDVEYYGCRPAGYVSMIKYLFPAVCFDCPTCHMEFHAQLNVWKAGIYLRV